MKNFCGFCGHDVTDEDEGEDGIICPKCKASFWRSETLPENYTELGYILLNSAI